jgi:hypothetical protein
MNHRILYIPNGVGEVSFDFDDVELARAKEFMEQHAVEDEDSLGVTRPQFSFTFRTTTIGNLIRIRDAVTGDEKDIANIDSW